MNDLWTQIESAFADNGVNPAINFGSGATTGQLRELESITSLRLDEDFHKFYTIHDGQRSSLSGAVFGLELLSTAKIIENWRNWETLTEENVALADSMSSQPPGHVQCLLCPLQWNGVE